MKTVSLTALTVCIERLIGQIMFWQRADVSDEEREITRSLKALKTLRFEGGRVSIDPEEVLHRPGYLDARRAAAALIREPGRVWNWEAVDEISLSLLRAIPSEPTCVRPSEIVRSNEAVPASVDRNIEEEVMVLGRVDRRLRDTRGSNCKR